MSEAITAPEDDLTVITTHARAKTDISHIHEFLGCRTSERWLNLACEHLPLLLQDHANCEKKAAGTAMNLIFRYEFHRTLQERLAQLVREEMLHYEQVLSLMQERNIDWHYLPAGRYAKGLLKHKRTYEPAAMVDVLIIGAFIEARSCERFGALSEVIDDEKLARYYKYLLKSESRHYEDYLMLARSITDDSIDERVAFFRDIECELIQSPDDELRFHSGIPSDTLMANGVPPIITQQVAT
ncbi:tRNA-(ms[2]io[6]A)-hydroxylase [Moraxella catarrhalis]|uniref:tRNA-(ms[2]io[6]A)-hydroxylase n=1 Tax=Moraxella catarrhalis TaxID=480 RepID=UPI0007E30BAD|nr:tRNA-(ms[2]io[6]A)-hydroxylase [Moraxella catarrhalis]MPW64371.1 tRNA-(ms[2]io[6]A)-hydroxylase [Moraxella catarrhalis]OAV13466.1 tRNA-ms2io6A-hydroxylase [Moraxella catarrhalis]OAV19002.1 tRNA-ms2io6A-hydroxylase [Moraxella catarrhalis]OBX44458.1 tRNA hydroxylase [Moraxella catarrhalis]